MSAVTFQLRELIFGSLEKSQKSQKLEPAKISCHTVKPNQLDSDSTQYNQRYFSSPWPAKSYNCAKKQTNKPKQAMN